MQDRGKGGAQSQRETVHDPRQTAIMQAQVGITRKARKVVKGLELYCISANILGSVVGHAACFLNDQRICSRWLDIRRASPCNLFLSFEMPMLSQSSITFPENAGYGFVIRGTSFRL
jgi:hypothetical protein